MGCSGLHSLDVPRAEERSNSEIVQSVVHLRISEHDSRIGYVAKIHGSVRRGGVSARYAATPNSWLMTRFWVRTLPLVTPLSWPLWSMCIASSP
jgi:hypothetical protein